MKRKYVCDHVRGISRRFVSLVMAVAVVTAFASPSVSFGAQDMASADSEEVYAWEINADGTETALREDEYLELKEGSVPAFPEAFEVTVDDGTDEASEDASLIDVTESDPEDAWIEGALDEDIRMADTAVEDVLIEDADTENPEEEDALLFFGANEDETAADEESMAIDAAAAGSEDAPEADGPVLEDETEAGESPEAAPSDDAFVSGGNAVSLDISLSAWMDTSLKRGNTDFTYTGNYGTIAASNYNINITQSGTKVTVNGSCKTPYYIYALMVDGNTVVTDLNAASISRTIDMGNYETGYHTVYVALTDGNIINFVGRKKMVSNTITDKPDYKGRFEVYAKSFSFYPYDVGFSNTAGNLYMEYKTTKAKTWKRSGYMSKNLIKLGTQQGYKISKLKAKTKYKTRLRYGVWVKYSSDWAGDNKSYFFGGPVLNTTTIKTGSSQKPAVKSVTAQAVNVKYHAVRHPGYYSYVGGTLFWHDAWTERFYTCRIKVTVRLKKKPGTAGMFVNDRWLKGNKTVYTTTFTPYPNYYARSPKGHYSYTVTIRSGQNKKWYGYSPKLTKKRRLS